MRMEFYHKWVLSGCRRRVQSLVSLRSMVVLVGRANRPRWGQSNCEEIGAGAMRKVLFSRGFAPVHPTKPPCDAGYHQMK